MKGSGGNGGRARRGLIRKEVRNPFQELVTKTNTAQNLSVVDAVSFIYRKGAKAGQT